MGKYYREPDKSGPFPFHLFGVFAKSLKRDHYVSDSGEIVYYQTDPQLNGSRPNWTYDCLVFFFPQKENYLAHMIEIQEIILISDSNSLEKWYSLKPDFSSTAWNSFELNHLWEKEDMCSSSKNFYLVKPSY